MTTTTEAERAPGKSICVAQISSEQCWADPTSLERNTAKVVQWYDRAADESDLVVFPELVLTGYIPLKGYDQKRKHILAGVANHVVDHALPEVLRATRGRRAAMVVGFMEPSTMRDELYNSIALIQDGAVLGVYRKMHLPVEENHYFVPGDRPVVVNCRAGRVGLIICYDIVFPEVARLAALQGAEILCAPSNWLAIEDLQRLGAVLPVARALEGQMHVVFANGVGGLEVRGRTWNLYGTSIIVSAVGDVVARGGPDEELISGVLTDDDLVKAGSVFPLLRDRRPDAYRDLVAPGVDFARVRPGIVL